MSLLSHIPLKKILESTDGGGSDRETKSDPIASFIREVDFGAYAELLSVISNEFREAPRPADQPAAANGQKLARIVGFQQPLDKLRMILASAGVNNAHIEGPRGIGKTSLVDGLIRLRAERRMGSRMMSKPFYLMDVSTFFKLGREDWVKQFDRAMTYVADHRGLVIIDHFDDFVRMADGEAARLVNTLVSALENYEDIQSVIISERDHADDIRSVAIGLERRFQKLPIEKEVDTKQLKQILLAQFRKLEALHNVDFTEEAADEIIRLTSRYPGRAFNEPRPKNAVKFADRTAAYVRLTQYSEPPEVTLLREDIAVLTDQIALLNDDEKAVHQAVCDELKNKKADFARKDAEWKEKFLPLLRLQENVVAEEAVINRFEKKGNARTKQEDEVYGKARRNRDEYQRKLAEIERTLSPKPPCVMAVHIRKVFSDESGVPLSNLSQDRLLRLAQLDSVLDSQIFKQERAKRALAQVYRAREMGVSDPSRPAGVLVFLGGTGLGKSELVKVLTRFDGGDGAEPVIIRFSEFKSETAVQKFLGADPGFAGFEQGAKFLDPLRLNSRSILLIDEADKAHPTMFDLLMQAFEEGVITTSQGIQIPLKDMIIVMAMNGITAASFTKTEEFENDALVREKLSTLRNEKGQLLFRPEFIGRIDEVVVFENLDKADAERILEKEIAQLNKDYRDRGLYVDPDDEATNAKIIERYHDASLGGRSPRAIVKQHIRPLLTNYVMKRAMEANGQDVPKENIALQIDAQGVITLSTAKGNFRPEQTNGYAKIASSVVA
jgi:ATP-dependent Clp protease ATP-binding subunit ClpA